MKTLRSHATKRAKMSPPVFSEQAMRVVLDQSDGTITGKIDNGVQLAAHAGIMHCHDGFGALRAVSLHLALIDIQCVRSNIDKDRLCSTQNKCIGRGSKSK